MKETNTKAAAHKATPKEHKPMTGCGCSTEKSKAKSCNKTENKKSGK